MWATRPFELLAAARRVVVDRFAVDRFVVFFAVFFVVLFVVFPAVRRAGFFAGVFLALRRAGVFVVLFVVFFVVFFVDVFAVFVARFRGAALARVVRFFAGDLRAPVFRACAVRVARGAARRRRGSYGGQASCAYAGGGTAAYSGCNSSTPKARRPPRHAAMRRAPKP